MGRLFFRHCLVSTPSASLASLLLTPLGSVLAFQRFTEFTRFYVTYVVKSRYPLVHQIDFGWWSALLSHRLFIRCFTAFLRCSDYVITDLHRAGRSWVHYRFRSAPSRYTFYTPRLVAYVRSSARRYPFWTFTEFTLFYIASILYNVSIMKPGPKPKESKVCPVCLVEKPRSDYYKKGDTISHKCKPCTLTDLKNRAPKYFGKYSEYVNEWKRTKYAEDQGYRDLVSQQKKAARLTRHEEIKAARRHRWATDPHCPDRKYYRRKDVKDRTPKWVDLNEILDFYAKCPRGYHVDHIVPLRGLIDGRPVTGLHVLWNLQYLTPEENLKKKNRISEATLENLG